MGLQYLPINWDQYHATSRKLAATVLSYPNKFDTIIAISRGGLTLGHMLSDFLRIPIATISVQSYSDIQKQGEVSLTAKLPTSIKGMRVLLVDDVSDTGKTFLRAKDYLKRLGPKDISTLAMFYKPKSKFRPDFFAKLTTKWIIFPYEGTEMAILLSESMAKEGKSKRDIQFFLEKLGFSVAQIAFVRKHHLATS